MGSQPLSPRRTRFYEQKLGFPLDRVLSHGGNEHWFSFRTPDHKHGWFRIRMASRKLIQALKTPSVIDVQHKTVEIEWADENWQGHWTSCRDQFPMDFNPVTREFIGRHPSAYGTDGVE